MAITSPIDVHRKDCRYRLRFPSPENHLDKPRLPGRGSDAGQLPSWARTPGSWAAHWWAAGELDSAHNAGQQEASRAPEAFLGLGRTGLGAIRQRRGAKLQGLPGSYLGVFFLEIFK
ncbi:hypothetical protein Droror1_Dr00026417 [Drosera rotundifolia]